MFPICSISGMEHFDFSATRSAIASWGECEPGGPGNRPGEKAIGELVRDIIARLDRARPCPASSHWPAER
jgi:hypothetical protein